MAQRSITLPPASLEESLNALSRQSGNQILVDQTLLRGKKAQAISGASSVETALGRLLEGSGLAWQRRGDTFLIVRQPSATLRPASAPQGDGRFAAEQPAPLVARSVEQDADAGGAIVVTGSRIARPELDNPMPVSVIDMSVYRKLGIPHPYDALRQDPAISAGIGLSNSFGSSSDSGIQTVSLRNMGASRTLTLVDGKRRVPGSSGTAAIDLNMIAPALIDRIEVVTGGAAAIYGADAVTGVVNVITKDSIDGLHIEATTGISRYGDAARTTISAATGGKFAEDRGSFTVGGTWLKTNPVYTGDRPFARDRILFQANPANTGPSDGISNSILIKDFRQIFVGYQPSFYRPQDGVVYIIDPVKDEIRAPIGGTQITGGTTGFWSGGEGGQLEDRRMLQTQLEALTFSAKVKYDISDTVSFRSRFDYGQTHYLSSTPVFRQDFRANTMNNNGGDVARLDNPYLPSSVARYMIDNNLQTLSISRAYENFPLIETRHRYNSFTIDNGLEGKLTDGLNWSAFFQYGRTTDDLDLTNTPLASRYVASRDVIADPVTGRPVCRDTAARAAGCVPLNIFSQDQLTDDQKKWLLTTRTMNYEITQKIFGASLAGRAFALPYGDVSMAAGVEHRVETVDRRDDPRSASGEVSYFGLQGPIPDLKAEQTVSEIFGELVVPVLRDLPFIHRLEVEGAYRYSHYKDTFGGTNTWKAGATWEPIAGVSIRGVRSRSVRAPNFGELYGPQTSAPSGSPADTCMGVSYYLSATRTANCKALGIDAPLAYNQLGPLVISGGNPDLKPETSDSLTLGVVLQPRFLPGFDATVDFWDIDIRDVIASFSSSDVYRLCTDLPTIENVFCESTVRDPVTHLATEQRTFLVNAQQAKRRGIDFGARYRTNLGAGTLGFSFKGSYLIEAITRTTPGIEAGDVISTGNYLNPRFRGTLISNYSTDKFDAVLNTRFISAARYAVGRTITDESYPDGLNRIAPVAYNDISLGYRVDERFRISFGIQNILDVQPKEIQAVQYGGSGQYDTIGRYFFTNVSITL